MTGQGKRVVFEMGVFTHADAHKDRDRMEAIKDLVAFAKSEVVSQSAMHASDNMMVTVRVAVDAVGDEPTIMAYGDPFECGPGEIVEIDGDDRFRTSNFIGFAVTYLVVFAFGYILHAGLSLQTPESRILSMSDKQIEVDLAYYQRKLSNASGVGCQMSVDEFRDYHGLKNERESRVLK